MQSDPAEPLSPTGILHAVLAYGIWGFAPIYWKETADFPAHELLAYRVLAAFVVALLLMLATGLWHEAVAVLRSPRRAGVIAAASALIATNWLVFIYAVQTDRILDTSLGYYINPLLNVALGLILLGERLSRAQSIAVALAAVGVGSLAWQTGGVPWISLVLAASFGLYGLMRKLAPTPPVVGFGLETLLLTPLAITSLALLGERGEALVPTASAGMKWLIAASGLITAAPLIAFASAANRLPLSALGMFQYLAPTLAFLLAVTFYGESFTPGHAVCFGCVWTALALSAWDSFQRAPARAS